MDSFSSFYNRPQMSTPNTRKHHQTVARTVGSGKPRKHLNFVPASAKQQKLDPIIDQWVKRDFHGTKPVSKGMAVRLMKLYGITNEPKVGQPKAIKDTGIFIGVVNHYGKLSYILTRK